MSRNKEQNMAIRAEKKQLIMDTALHLFAQNGFERTSIANIAKQAGISSGLVYNYFESKDDLLHQILDSGLQLISNLLHPDMTVEEFIKKIEALFDSMTENLDFWKLYSIISVQPTVTQKLVEIRNEYDGMSKDLTNFFTKHFGKEQVLEELIMYSVIMKGFTVIYVFSDIQKTFPADMLKKVVISYIKERFEKFSISKGNI